MIKGLGYFLGVTLGAAALFFIISYLFLRPRNVTEIQINEFIKNSDNILIDMIPLKEGGFYGVDERLGTDVISKITYFSNRSMTYVRADTYTYFSKELKKYVRTYSINEGYMSGALLEFGKQDKDKTIWPDVYIFYNKVQNADPSYGTIEKPLPILHFRSADPALRSMRQNNKDADPAYLKRVYDENVKLYLQYFIEKEDFKKLYPDS